MEKQLDILVVEDTRMHQEAAKELLKEHNLTIASTLEEATNHLLGYFDWTEHRAIPLKHFDVVLTDLFFPAGRTACTDKWTEAALGLPVALIAAQQGVKYIAMVTNLNCYQDPIVSAFEFFKCKEKVDSGVGCREPYCIDGSLFMAYDVRDLPAVFLLRDGTFTEKKPRYSHTGWNRDQEADLKAGYISKIYEEHGEHSYINAKNWKAALELLLKCGEKKD